MIWLGSDPAILNGFGPPSTSVVTHMACPALDSGCHEHGLSVWGLILRRPRRSHSYQVSWARQHSPFQSPEDRALEGALLGWFVASRIGGFVPARLHQWHRWFACSARNGGSWSHALPLLSFTLIWRWEAKCANQGDMYAAPEDRCHYLEQPCNTACLSFSLPVCGFQPPSPPRVAFGFDVLGTGTNSLIET